MAVLAVSSAMADGATQDNPLEKRMRLKAARPACVQQWEAIKSHYPPEFADVFIRMCQEKQLRP